MVSFFCSCLSRIKKCAFYNLVATYNMKRNSHIINEIRCEIMHNLDTVFYVQQSKSKS